MVLVVAVVLVDVIVCFVERVEKRKPATEAKTEGGAREAKEGIDERRVGGGREKENAFASRQRTPELSMTLWREVSVPFGTSEAHASSFFFFVAVLPSVVLLLSRSLGAESHSVRARLHGKHELKSC